MYVRQFKQYLRGVDPKFDEHKWGFATIMEFLRVCQREGLLRLERDRRGQIRVFPGSALQLALAMTPVPTPMQSEEVRDILEAEPVGSTRENVPRRAELESRSVGRVDHGRAHRG